MASEVLDRERETYRRELEHLLTIAPNEYVLIHGDDVIGTYVAQQDAIREGYRRLGNVPFLVRHIVRFEEPLNFFSPLIAG